MINITEKFDLYGKIAIIVGGSGLIGSQTVETLINANCKVVNIDLYNNRKKTSLVCRRSFNFFFFVSKQN